MKMRTTAVAALALALALPLTAAPSVTRSPQDEKEKKVRKLLEVTGAAATGKQVLDSMMDQFAKLPDLPPGFVDKFKEIADGKQRFDLIVPIYLKHLDEETIDAGIAYYESPAGKKFLKAQPAIVQESMAAGQKWGGELAQKALKALEKDKDK